MIRRLLLVLDSSSDALAYVAGHHARLEHTGELLEALVPAGSDRWEDVRAYRRWIEDVLDALLFATIVVRERDFATRRSGRALWDRVQRAAHLGGAAARWAEAHAREAGAEVGRALAGKRYWRQF